MLKTLSLVVIRKLLYLKITGHVLQMHENKNPEGLMILFPNLQHNLSIKGILFLLLQRTRKNQKKVTSKYSVFIHKH